MQHGAINGYIDVAQVTLYVFWIFFAGLIYYLRREDKREGYPLDANRGDRVAVSGFPNLPKPKAFILPHGGVRYAPRYEAPIPVIGAVPTSRAQGAPLTPTGNPLIDGVGPAAYANRPDEPDLTWDNGIPKLVPLRVATEFSIAAEDPDPRGMEVIGTDGLSVGVVTDVWVDRSETIFRYLEVRLASGLRTVMVPMTVVQFAARRQVKVRSLRADQFTDIPALKHPDQITLLEEDKVMGYFGGGTLYAAAERLGPVL